VLAEFLVVHRSSNDGSSAPDNFGGVSGAAAAAAASLIEQQLKSAATVDPFLAALGASSGVDALCSEQGCRESCLLRRGCHLRACVRCL
jgi:hypothetical protein